MKSHPPAPPPPTVSFGKLPKIIFPELPDKPKLSYKLETIEGSLPQLTEIVKVFFMPQGEPNLLASDEAIQTAQRMGFKDQPEVVQPTFYRWKTTAIIPTTLEMDIYNGTFRFFSEYQNDEEIKTAKNLPSQEEAAQESKSFLERNGFLPSDLANGTVGFEYFRLENGLIPVTKLPEAQLIRVNFFRADLEELKILPPYPKNSLVSFLFSGSRTTGKRILEINYSYYPIEKEIFSTYPLKPITQAWNELQAGDGHLVNYPAGQNLITVRKAYLAYYDSSAEKQHFLQPIYVFEGDGNFIAYVAALDPQWTE